MNLGRIQSILFETIYRRTEINFLTKRLYGRWMHRKSAKVFLPFEGSSLKKENIIDLSSNNLESPEKENALNLKNKNNSTDFVDNVQETDQKNNNSSEKFKKIKEKRETLITKKKNEIHKQNVFNENNEIIYDKLKDNDGRISSLLIKLKSKRDRARSGQILVEGWRLIVDGLEAKCPLRYLIFSNLEDLNNLKPFLPKTGVKIYKIPYKEIQLWSDVETSPGVFGVFETPSTDSIKRLQMPMPIQIICDNIRVPGNLGSILRAAVGVGCHSMFLMKGCVDYWDPKVLRSGAGAHFRLPVHSAVEWEDLPNLLDDDTSVFIADHNSKVALNDRSNTDNNSTLDTSDRIGLHIPVLPYYSIEFGSLKSITLIVGGETEGISEDCYRFAASRNGLRLNIPLQKGIDSLNTGMATAVIAFEIKKQLLQAKYAKINECNSNIS